jgi:hypothetical protein
MAVIIIFSESELRLTVASEISGMLTKAPL